MKFSKLSLYISISVLLGISHFLVAQDQKVADSLKQLLNQEVAVDTIYMNRLKELAFHEQDPLLSEEYADRLIKLALIDSSLTFLFDAYLQKGNANRLKGNLQEAVKSLFKCRDVAIQLKDDRLDGMACCSIADVYSVSGNIENANLYYEKGIAKLRLSKDTTSLATALLNSGDEFLLQEKYNKALSRFEEAEVLYNKLNYKPGIAYNLGNKGIAYAGLGNSLLAELHINEAIVMLEEMEDYYSISVYLTYLSDIYDEKHDHNNALKYAKRSLELAEKYGLKDQISEASLQLSDLYDHVGDAPSALLLYKKHITYRDSFHNLEVMQNLANMRTEHEVSQKQLEVDLLEQQQKNQRLSIIGSLFGLGLMMVTAFGMYRRYKFMHKTNKIIADEKLRSEELLLNILPEETAAELKEFGKVQAKKFDSTTVLFTDFVGFTKQAEKLTPVELVESIDYYFSNFDKIIHKHDLEKIKTVGDAYLCAGGLPYPTDDHHVRILAAAHDIVAFVEGAKHTSASGKATFEVRVGINSGPLVAGVVGTKKFAYDIWGDTVNISSRMETNSKAGCINVSENTYQLIKDLYHCEYHSDFVTKNGNKIKMYFVGNKK